jgi:LCP family protein required for cell wall assembly
LGLALVSVPLLWAAWTGVNLWSAEGKIYKQLSAEANATISVGAGDERPLFEGPPPTPGAVAAAGTPSTVAVWARGRGPLRDIEPPTGAVGTAAPLTPAAVATGTAARGKSSIAEWKGKKRINVLVIGLDQRKDEPTRADTIIVAALDFERNTADILSVPRDLYVRVPDFSWWKVNAAYALGENPKFKDDETNGVSLLARTLRYNLGIPSIDEAAVLRFNGLKDGVDAMGGIVLTIPKKLVDTRYPDGPRYRRVEFEAGTHRLNGTRALQYSRMRHPGGDFGRIRRQQQVMLAIRERADDPGVLLKAPSLINTLKDNLETSVGLRDRLRLAQWAAALPKQNIRFHSIEGDILKSKKGELVVWPDWDEVNPMLRTLFGPTAGHPSELE